MTGVRTYEIVTTKGQFRLDIPEGWKVTYGPVIGAKGYEGGGNVFRVWETDKQQRALFSGVTSFRDLSMPLLRAAVRRYGSEEWTIDDGSYHGKKAETVEHGWMPIDEIQPVAAAEASADENDPGPKTIATYKRV